MIFDGLRVLVRKVLSELGDIVNLDLVPQARLFLETWTQSVDLTWGFRNKNWVHTFVDRRGRIR